MSFIETEFSLIDIELLESVLYNIEKEIPKIGMTVQFDDVQKYELFVNRINPVVEEDDDVVSNSNSQLEEETQTVQNNSLVSENYFQSNEFKYVEKLCRLELSIILKQNYQQQINKIAKQTNVKILIVPEKLKFFANSQDDIDEARSRVHEIKTNIIISTLEKYGRQACESNYLRSKMSKHGINMGKIAQKYYYWYDDTKCNQKIIQQVIDSIFNKNVHIFYPLLEGYENLRSRYNKKYINAIINANAKLYQQFLEPQINEDKNNDHKVQLNDERVEVIIHVKVLQQAQIIKHQFKKFFSELVQFFIHYQTDENLQIAKFAQIEAKLNQKGILWSRHQDLIVLNFSEKNINRPNESISNMTVYLEDRQKQFLQNLKQVIDINVNCSIQYMQKIEQSEEDLRQKLPEELIKKISIQHKKFDGVTIIAPKNLRTNLFLQIINHLILKPMSSPNKQKKDEKSQMSGLDGGMSITNPICDTTSKVEISNLTQNKDDENIGSNLNDEGNFKKQNVEKLILAQIKTNQVFENYKYYYKDIQNENKYDDIQQLRKGKGKFPKCEQLQQQLQQITRRKFKPYLSVVPQKYKPQNYEIKQDTVTVFMRDANKQHLDDPVLFVFLITDSKVLSANGWMINVRKSMIKQTDYRYQIQKGTFQIIMFLKYIEG